MILEVDQVVDPSLFLEYFGRQCKLPVSSLFCSTDSDHEEEFCEYAKGRVTPVSGERIWEDVMLPSMKDRLRLYIKKYGLLCTDPRTGKIRHAIVCLNHNPNSRPRICLNPSEVGSYLFNLTHHGFFFHTELWRPMLTLEWAFAHHIITSLDATVAKRDVVDVRSVMGQGIVKRAQVRALAGLGWHEGAIGSWLMFLLASVELKSLFQNIPQQVQVPLTIIKYNRLKRRKVIKEEATPQEDLWASEVFAINVDD